MRLVKLSPDTTYRLYIIGGEKAYRDGCASQLTEVVRVRNLSSLVAKIELTGGVYERGTD